YGGTDAPRGGYDLASLTDDLLSFLDRTADPTKPIDLMGHDWGAGISWYAAAYHPERFHSVSVLSIPHPRTPDQMMKTSPAQRKYKRFVRTLLNPLAPVILASLGERRFGSAFYRKELQNDDVLTDTDVAYYHTLYDTPREVAAKLRYYRALFGARARRS